MNIEEQHIYCTLTPEHAAETLLDAAKEAKSHDKQAIIADAKAFSQKELLLSLPRFTGPVAGMFLVIVHSISAMTTADEQNLTTDGGLIVMPSYEEAVDAVFMHLLEQELNDHPDSEI